MEENKHDRIENFLIIIIMILVIIVSSASTIIIYNKILNSRGEKHLVDTLNEDLNNLENNISNNAKLKLPITMNGENVNVEIETNFEEWEIEEEALFNQKTLVRINDKICDELETTTYTQVNTLNYEIPEVKLLTDSSIEREYILLVMNSYSPSSKKTIIKVYDNQGKIITEFDNLGKTEVILKENNYTIPVYELYNDNIIICEALNDGGARLHEYTIENGELKDEIIREYTSDEVEQAGATA